MNSKRISNWLSIVANVAVVLGLLFLGIELRNSRKALTAQTSDAIADGFLHLNLATISDSTVAKAWVLGLHNPNRLTDLEAIQFSMYLRGVFNQLQRIHSLYQSGLLTEAEWAPYAREAAFMLSTPGGQIHFKLNWIGESFRADVERFNDQLPNIDFRMGRDSIAEWD